MRENGQVAEPVGGPAYQQVARDLRERIASAEFPVGSAIPSTAKLREIYGVSITVLEEYAERWVIIDRLDTYKQPVDHDTAYALADAAFDGVPYGDVEEIFERTEILGGRHVIEPGHVYAWCAVV